MIAALREHVLRAVTYPHGVRRVVNGLPLRVAAPVRALFTEDYDRTVAELLRGRIPPGSEVWNVGANVGVYVLQLASWVGPDGHVVAFEPNPRAARVLRENLRLNKLAGRVEVIETAVGEQEGFVDLYTDGTSGMARAGRPNPLLRTPRAVRVPVTTLDAFLARRERVPSWIMMDIEGWEIAALRGARTLLRQTRIAVELHPSAWPWSGHTRSDLQRILDDSGLVAVPMIGQADPLDEHGQVVLEPRELR